MMQPLVVISINSCTHRRYTAYHQTSHKFFCHPPSHSCFCGNLHRLAHRFSVQNFPPAVMTDTYDQVVATAVWHFSVRFPLQSLLLFPVQYLSFSLLRIFNPQNHTLPPRPSLHCHPRFIKLITFSPFYNNASIFQGDDNVPVQAHIQMPSFDMFSTSSLPGESALRMTRTLLSHSAPPASTPPTSSFFRHLSNAFMRLMAVRTLIQRFPRSASAVTPTILSTPPSPLKSVLLFLPTLHPSQLSYTRCRGCQWY